MAGRGDVRGRHPAAVLAAGVRRSRGAAVLLAGVRRSRGAAVLLAGAVAVAGAVAGCGDGGEAAGAGRKAATGARAAAAVDPAAAADARPVATVAGAPVTRAAFEARRRLELLRATAVATGRLPLREAQPRTVDFDGAPARCAADLRALAVAPLDRTVAAQSDAQLRRYCRDTARKLRYQTLNGLLAARVTSAEARKRGIAVSDADVRAEQERVVAQLGGGAADLARLARLGVSPAVVRDVARIAALERRLSRAIVAREGRVTAADRRAFYLRNRDKFDHSERRDLLVVEAPTAAAARAAARELAAGRPFGEVAARRSRAGRARRERGRLAYVARRGLPPELARKAFAAAGGTLVGPFEGRSLDDLDDEHVRSHYLVKVTEVIPAGAPRLDRLAGVITKAVAPDKAERALAGWQRRVRAAWRPRIDCRTGYVVSELCGTK
jgi:parvulin-like peptidyl-prolyl isomerase